MANIALFVPFVDMLDKAVRVIDQNHYQVALLKRIDTFNAIEEARNAMACGINIIIARGCQAQLIKTYTNIPLVEIRLHSQEIGLMILKAKKLLGKASPHIGLIVYNNMLCDMSHMEELFQIRLSICFIDEKVDVSAYVKELQQKQADIIIGGEIVCRAAEESGMPALLYESMETSIAEALETAERMAYAQEAEKQTNAQFSTILDNIVNGIVKINVDGTITLINHHIETLLEKNSPDVVGSSIYDVFPQIEASFIHGILDGKRESYASSVRINKRSLVLVVSPIQYDSTITGAILSFHTTNSVPQAGARNGSKYTADTTFDKIETKNEQMKKTLSLAKMYAISNSPVLICGPEGTECRQIAEAIHNNSNRKAGAFVSVNVSGLNERQQIDILLGNGTRHPESKEASSGAIARAHQGTLLLCGVEGLSPRIQHELSHMITETQNSSALDVRIIAATHKNLVHLLSSQQFSNELFYHLQGLTLEIPPISRRPEDLVLYFDKYFQQFTKKYNRYFKLTNGARQKLTHLKWEGNLIQLKTFTERLVITSQKRTIDEVVLEELYDELYPVVSETEDEERIVVYKSPEAAELQALLEKHHGNRTAMAKELGISATTLWRRLKKYRIT